MGTGTTSQDGMIATIRQSGQRACRIAHLSDVDLAGLLQSQIPTAGRFSPLSDAVEEAIYRLSKPYRTPFLPPENQKSRAEKSPLPKLL